MHVIQWTREHFSFFMTLQTRWADNDMYGHVNNVTYYSYFDTAANQLLIQHCGFNPKTADIIGLVVSSSCQFKREITYPECIDIGVRIQRLGTSSVQYCLAIFTQNNTEPAAIGEFTHVFVNRQTRKSTPIPDEMRRALKQFSLNL